MTSSIHNNLSANAWMIITDFTKMEKLRRKEPNDKELFVMCFLIPKSVKDYQILKSIPQLLPLPFASIAAKKEGEICRFSIEDISVLVNAVCTNRITVEDISDDEIPLSDVLKYAAQVKALPEGSFENRVYEVCIAALLQKKTFLKKLNYAARIVSAKCSRLANENEQKLKRVYELAGNNLKKMWFVPDDSSSLAFSSNHNCKPVMEVYYLLNEVMTKKEKREFCKSNRVQGEIQREIFKDEA